MTVPGSIRVGPVGLDETERVTVPLNLTCAATKTVVVLLVWGLAKTPLKMFEGMVIVKSGPLTITAVTTEWVSGLLVPIMLAVPVNVTWKVPALEAVNEQTGEVPVLPFLVKLILTGVQDTVIPLLAGTVAVRLICPKKESAEGVLEKIKPPPLIPPWIIETDAGLGVIRKSATIIVTIME